MSKKKIIPHSFWNSIRRIGSAIETWLDTWSISQTITLIMVVVTMGAVAIWFARKAGVL